MIYTVGELAKILNIQPSTLRYYDKEGLLPFVERSSGGIRMFKESDVEWLKIIECMKKAGMSIKDIRTYIQLAMQGDCTIDDRLALFIKQREELKKQLESLENTLDVLDYKVWFYKKAKELGSTNKVKNLKEEDIPEHYLKIKKELAKK